MGLRKRDQSKWQENNIDSLLFHTAKSRAKYNGIEFSITRDDIVVPEICPILKVKLDHTRKVGRRFNGASLDRIDSSKGYIKGNVWVISDLANRMKQNATVEQLIQFGEWTKTLKE